MSELLVILCVNQLKKTLNQVLLYVSQTLVTFDKILEYLNGTGYCSLALCVFYRLLV